MFIVIQSPDIINCHIMNTFMANVYNCELMITQTEINSALYLNFTGKLHPFDTIILLYYVHNLTSGRFRPFAHRGVCCHFSIQPLWLQPVNVYGRLWLDRSECCAKWNLRLGP